MDVPFFALFVFLLASLVQGGLSNCRCIPGDDCWPTEREWQSLNETLGGRLIATVLLANVCHDPNYNETACEMLKLGWPYPQTHFNSPSSFMAPYFQNETCSPYTPREQPCTLGNYISYAINVTCAEEVSAGLLFAKEKNIRVVIKGTGHDYLGKSTGKGGLGIWTHNLKDISFCNHSSSYYSGSAIKMGAGVQGFEAYAAADTVGLRVVGGECPTVGLVGGYTQGGGHSALSSNYGLAADQTLEWEVLTANGSLVTASPTVNTDLYWALSGGGGGTYGVVLSLTAKAHPDGVVSGAIFSLNSTYTTSHSFWNTVSSFFTHLPPIVDAGGMAVYYIAFNTLTIQFTFPDHDNSSANSLLQPFISSLSPLSLPYALKTTSFPRYYQHVDAYFGPLPYGSIPNSQVTGGRLIPRSVVQNNVSSLISVIRNIASRPDFMFAGESFSVSHAVAGNSPSSNAVLPAFRDALLSVTIAGIWNYSTPLIENDDRERTLTDVIGPLLESCGGKGKERGIYMNEGNFGERDWRKDFYGANFGKLKEVKDKWDSEGLLYARTAVGSENWKEDGMGRLCRVWT